MASPVAQTAAGGGAAPGPGEVFEIDVSRAARLRGIFQSCLPLTLLLWPFLIPPTASWTLGDPLLFVYLVVWRLLRGSSLGVRLMAIVPLVVCLWGGLVVTSFSPDVIRMFLGVSGWGVLRGYMLLVAGILIIIFGLPAFWGVFGLRTPGVLAKAQNGDRLAAGYRAFILKNARYTPLNIALIVLVELASIASVLLWNISLQNRIFGWSILSPYWLFGLYASIALILNMHNALFHRLGSTVTWEMAAAARGRGYCLYLRSFWDDRASVEGTRWRYLIWTPRRQHLEDIATRALWPRFPVAAVGLPVEQDSPVAALRVPLEGKEWRTVVAELIDFAAFFVYMAGFSEGLKWEHHALKERGLLSRSAVVFLDANPDARCDRWRLGLGLDDAGVERLVGRTLVCRWTEDDRRIHITSRKAGASAYYLALRLACLPMNELLALAKPVAPKLSSPR